MSLTLPPLLAIVGPTAIGKTGLALCLAESLGLEVVSADSRQIYQGMDVGTAKPTPYQRGHVPHHLLDVVSPAETLTLAGYQAFAFAAIDGILERGGLPMLVGGTGLYVWAVLENWLIPRVPPDQQVRRRLERQADEHGAVALHTRLREVDPRAADSIHPANVRRVIRALEVHVVTGRPISEQQRRGEPRYRALVLGLTMERRALYERADRRVDAMMADGLVEETKALLAAGCPHGVPALSGLGYRQVIASLRGDCDLAEAARRTKTATHRYIRQQYTWFRLDDERICWHEQPVDAAVVEEQVRAFLGDPAAGGSIRQRRPLPATGGPS